MVITKLSLDANVLQDATLLGIFVSCMALLSSFTKDICTDVCLDVNWIVVKPDYLKKSKKKEAVLSWVRFLTKLGVKTGIAVQRVNVHIAKVCLQMMK